MLKLQITRNLYQPSGSNSVHYVTSQDIPDDPVVVAMIVEAVAKAMHAYNKKHLGRYDNYLEVEE